MKPWHKFVIPRKEMREGRFVDPNKFTITFEQVMTDIISEDYCESK